ncbi:MAG: haloacid dehalogenase-like hydrolase [Saprospiraceae bacterium]|nr:haloacid dehalogenase-like hydrolase [Saprospiraceae bacterium]
MQCKQADQTNRAEPTKITTKDPLPSWNEAALKQSIVAFVGKVTKEGSPEFLQPSDRIAVFDNDGTLWAEQPVYFQAAFIFDRVKALAPQHPEWKQKQPFKAVLDGDLATALGGGEKSIGALLAATHAGMTDEAFDQIVLDWIKTAKHPTTGKAYTDMVYQPMLELLDYLRANGFKTFIVSGGGIDFMRPWTQQVYGIPAEQVIGSSLKVKYEVVDGKPSLLRLPELNFIDDGPGKPVGIHQHIGKRPVFVAGNSDGDYDMMQYTMTNPLPHFGLLIHHTDATREWAYDRESHIGKLNKGLDDAGKYGWQVVDMAKDWKVVYPGG